MSDFKLTDLNKIKDFTRLTNALNEYNGVLPKYLRVFTNIIVYENNLKKKGIYDKVEEEYYSIRINRKQSSNSEEFDIKELNDWLNENKDIYNL